MNNIDYAKILKLMRIVDVELRKRWERTMIGGRSLLDVQKEREDAYISFVRCQRRNDRAREAVVVLIAIILLGAIGLTASQNDLKAFIVGLITVAVIIITALIISKMFDKTESSLRAIAECDRILLRFESSINALDCIGEDDLLDKIDEVIVRDRLVEAALALLDAQDVVDDLRRDQDASRSDIIRSAKTVDLLQKRFDAIQLRAANDFTLTFSGASIFRDARKRLDARRSKNKKANGVTSTR